MSEQQAALLTFQGREALYGGAVGGGKSAGLLAAALRYVDRRGYRALLLRRTFAELAKGDGLMPLAQEWLAPSDARGVAARDGIPSRWVFPSGATIEFGHVQHEGDKHAYQGAAYTFVGFDELTHFTEGIYLYIGFSRQRRRTALGDIPVQTYASANPGGVGHLWVRRRFIDQRAHETLFVPATVRDNPGLDADDYELSLNHLPIALRKQLMEGDWGAFEGAAYDVQDGIHTVGVLAVPPEWERFEFMDHGTANPTAWYLMAVDYDGNLIVTDGYYSPGLVSEHAKVILGLRPAWYPTWPDQDGRMQRQHPVTISDPAVTQRLGFTAKNGVPGTISTEYHDQSDGEIVLTPGNHDRQAGKARIQELLRCDPDRYFPEWHPRRGEKGAPRLFIVEDRCPQLVEQLKAAPILALDSGKKGAGEIVDDEWESQYGHAHAALRYGVMSRPDPTPQPEPVPTDPRTIWMQETERRRNANGQARLIDV